MRELNIKSVRAIARAVDILNVFTMENSSLTVDEIMEEVQLPKTTIYRILYTLENVGLIRYDQKTQKYMLGLQILGYAGVLSSNLDIKNEAEDILMELQIKTKQTVIMAVPEGLILTYVYKRENPEGMKYSSFIGLRKPMHYGVLGHVLMAYLPPNQLDELLMKYPIPQLTKKTFTDQELVKKRLRRIKSEGSFIDRDETYEGGTGIGSPVFDVEGNCIAAIGIIGPTVQIKGEIVNNLTETIKKAAFQISRKMGYVEGKSASFYP